MNKNFVIINGVLTNPADIRNANGRYDSILADIRIREWIASGK